MHFRRFACFLLGLLIAGSGFMDVVAIHNFRGVDRYLAAPRLPAATQIHDMGRDNVRLLLRRFAGEQNRWYFEQWEWTETALSLSILLVILLALTPSRLTLFLALAILAITLGDRFGFTPQISRLGRVLEDMQAATAPAERTLFWTLHGLYSGLEMLKLALAMWLAAKLMIRGRPDRGLFARRAAGGEAQKSPTLQ